MRLSAIYRYPLKSGRAQPLTTAEVQPWGLAGDRRWMVVDAEGQARTARQFPHLVLVQAEPLDGALLLRSPTAGELRVPVPFDGPVEVSIFGRQPFPVRAAAADAHAFVSEIVGQPSRLVYQADPTTRPTNPQFTGESDRVSLADSYPILLATEASLGAVNDWIAEGRHADEGPVPMARFRPNLVIAGTRAWAEDAWRRVRIGALTFRVVKGCDRCVLTTIDPDTARVGREPLASLVRHRRWDGQSWFAVNLVPEPAAGAGPNGSDAVCGRLRVGDDVQVLVDEPDADGPLR